MRNGIFEGELGVGISTYRICVTVWVCTFSIAAERYTEDVVYMIFCLRY